ncbi:MAG: DUF3604 domain-containing protein [Armatimonadota bacterium]
MKMNRREMLKLSVMSVGGLMVGRVEAREVNMSLSWKGLRPISGSNEEFEDSPAVSGNGLGMVWAASLVREPGDRERLLARRMLDNGVWEQPIIVNEGAMEFPAVVCLADGTALVVWTLLSEDRRRLMASFVSTDSVRPLSTPSSPGKPAYPTMAVSSDGSVWLTWEAWSKGKMKVCLSRFNGESWSRTIIAAGEERGAYDPSIACDSKGRAWIAWSGNDADRHRNIYLAAYDAGMECVDGPIDITQGDCLEGICALNSHPSVACDREGRVWVAWEHDGKTSSRVHSPSTGNWIGRREVSAVCWDGKKLKSPGGKTAVFANENDHLPMLIVDPSGTMFALTRASKGLKQPGPGLFEDRRTWDVRASRLTPKGWTEPVALLTANAGVPEMGRLHQPVAAIVKPGELRLVWQADDYQSHEVVGQQKLPVSWLNSSTIAYEPSSHKGLSLSAMASQKGAETKKIYFNPKGDRRTIDVDGEKYTLIWGNCHEHTLISRCWGDGSDATPDEDYRYGYDIEGYDFIAMTDHDFDSWEMMWRATRRAASFYNDPPYTIANPAYEWTLSGAKILPSNGHRNIILASDEDARKMMVQSKVISMDRPGMGRVLDQVWKHMRENGIEGVTIPHHTADADHTIDWSYHDPEYQTAVEIFQCRLSCEYRGCPRQTTHPSPLDGVWVWDALARGYRMGFVASGDHNSMGMGRTALLVKEMSQAGIVEALRSRRCFATTCRPIVIDFRVDGRIMGSEYIWQGGSEPVVTAKVEGTAPLQEVAIIKNCKIVHTISGDQLKGATDFNLTWKDPEFGGVSSWYYLRAIQTDNEIAWASPVWVDVNP